MSRHLADIPHNRGGVTSKSSPKTTTRRMNASSMKVARAIRMAVLAHDPGALSNALKTADSLNLDSHLIKAARTTLADMQNTMLADENVAPEINRPLEMIRKTSSRSIRYESDSTESELSIAPEGDTQKGESTLPYIVSDAQHHHPLPEVPSPKEEIVFEGIDRFRTVLQPALSERIARIRLESTKLDICCKDLCLFIKAVHAAQEKSANIFVSLAEETHDLAVSKSGMSLESPGLLFRGQLLSKAERNREFLHKLRTEAMLPVAVTVPSMEIEIRSLFEEAAFLELECSKSMTDIDRCSKQESSLKVAEASMMSHDEDDDVTAGSIRESRTKPFGVGRHLLRRPSASFRTDSEPPRRPSVEAEFSFNRMFSEYLKRLPEIIERVSSLNSQRMEVVRKSLTMIVSSQQRQLEVDMADHHTFADVVGRIDVEKDLGDFTTLARLDDFSIEDEIKSSSISMSISPPGGNDAFFMDSARPRSYAVDLWAGHGIRIALEHTLMSKNTLSCLFPLMDSWAHLLQQRSDSLTKIVRIVKAQNNDAGRRIGDSQQHAFDMLMTTTETQAAKYASSASALKQAGSDLNEQKALIKRCYRTVSDCRARGQRELNTAYSHEAKCKEAKERLESELSESTTMVNKGAADYKNNSCSCHSQLEVLLSKLERDEHVFRQADLKYRNAQHSVQAMREAHGLMQCQFLRQLQTVEQSRLKTCSSSLVTLGREVRDLVSSIEQCDLDVLSAFASIDLTKDLKQFVKSTYPADDDYNDVANVDYMSDLCADGFGPAYDHAMSGLMQMKSMMMVLDQWVDSTDHVRALSKIKINIGGGELPSVQAALVQVQELMSGFCQSVEEQSTSQHEVLSSIVKQRHALKSEARKLRKTFADGHRRVTLATRHHDQAVETQRRLIDKLEVIREQNVASAPSPASKYTLSRLFSRDISKTLQKTQQGVESSNHTLDRLHHDLSSAVRDRDASVQSALQGLQEIETHRVAALNWCVPTLISHRQSVTSQIASLSDQLVATTASIDTNADLDTFIRSNAIGSPPPAFLIDRVIQSTPNIADPAPTIMNNDAGLDRVPTIVTTCVAFLSMKQTQPASFRESPPPDDVRALMNDFTRDPDLTLLNSTSVVVVAAVLKAVVMDLELIPSTMVSELLLIYKNASSLQRCQKIAAWLEHLPPVNKTILKLLLLFMWEISRQPTEQVTNMAVTALAICWSPVLLRSTVGSTIQALSRLVHDTPTIFSHPDPSLSS